MEGVLPGWREPGPIGTAWCLRSRSEVLVNRQEQTTPFGHEAPITWHQPRDTEPPQARNKVEVSGVIRWRKAPSRLTFTSNNFLLLKNGAVVECWSSRLSSLLSSDYEIAHVGRTYRPNNSVYHVVDHI